jgi:hypothetical protein
VNGLSGINRSVIAERERTIFDWANARGIGVAFVLAGGYAGPRLNPEGLVELHRLTVQAAASSANPAAYTELSAPVELP